MSKRITKTDHRLIGTWRSDRRRSLKDWIWKPHASAEQRKRVADIFGHLVIRFARQKMHTDFKGERYSRIYSVLASDQDSVAILHGSSLLDGQSIQHIHFVGDRHYWIALGRGREWFKKIYDA
jgi:hypothetical protein